MKVNSFRIAGRLVEDAEINYLPGSGIPALKLRVVVDSGYYDTKKSEYVKRPVYVTVKRINKDADTYNLRKDDWVYAEGMMLTDSWDGRDGKKVYANYLQAQQLAEIADPWEKKDRGGGSDRRDNGRGSGSDRSGGGGRDDRDKRDDRSSDRDRRDDRSGGRQDSRRDDRDRDRKSDGRDNRDRDRRDDRPREGDDIPF